MDERSRLSGYSTSASTNKVLEKASQPAWDLYQRELESLRVSKRFETHRNASLIHHRDQRHTSRGIQWSLVVLGMVVSARASVLEERTNAEFDRYLRAVCSGPDLGFMCTNLME